MPHYEALFALADQADEWADRIERRTAAIHHTLEEGELAYSLSEILTLRAQAVRLRLEAGRAEYFANVALDEIDAEAMASADAEFDALSDADKAAIG
jgi:hypothetical protein